MTVELLNVDCMEYMASQPDNSFDIGIVDPPYGIGETWKKDRSSCFYKHQSSYKNNTVPDQVYFNELFRITENQIVWGANYYTEFLPPRNSWIVWDKSRDWKNQKLSEGELAWTSFNVPLRFARFTWNGFVTCEPRYGQHPHEKPVSLYQWLLQEYSRPGKRILDTHLGSGSSAIAAYYFGCNFVGCEIDTKYYQATVERFKEATRQLSLIPMENVS